MRGVIDGPAGPIGSRSGSAGPGAESSRGVRVGFVIEHLTFDPGGEDPLPTLQLHLVGAVAQLERSLAYPTARYLALRRGRPLGYLRTPGGGAVGLEKTTVGVGRPDGSHSGQQIAASQ